MLPPAIHQRPRPQSTSIEPFRTVCWTKLSETIGVKRSPQTECRLDKPHQRRKYDVRPQSDRNGRHLGFCPHLAGSVSELSRLTPLSPDPNFGANQANQCDGAPIQIQSTSIHHSRVIPFDLDSPRGRAERARLSFVPSQRITSKTRHDEPCGDSRSYDDADRNQRWASPPPAGPSH